MDHDSAMDFCSRWLSAWTGGRDAVEHLLSFYDKDVFYLDPMWPMGLKDRDSMKKYLEKLLTRYPDWRYRTVEVIPTEKGFVLKWELTVPVKNEKTTIRGLDIVEVAGGLITRNEVYFDRTELMK